MGSTGGSQGAAETVALAATLLCVWACAFGAFRVPRETPRLFMALALFGLNWGFLLLYYLPGPPQNEILAAFSGFTLVYVGVLLLREAREGCGGARKGEIGWADRLPLLLFRPTVGGFGVYLIARRIFHAEVGYGTLALAMWGTLLTVLGYVTIGTGLTALFAGTRHVRKVGAWLGVLLAVYSLCEISYSVWYARDYWPRYHRYLKLETARGTPDLERPLPFEVRSSWPEPEEWKALQTRPDWPKLRPLLALKVEPQLPEMPVWLEYAFSGLKLLLTGAVLLLLSLRPSVARNADESFEWVDRSLGRARA